MCLYFNNCKFTPVQDKACAAVDEHEASSPSEYETDEEWEDERKMKQVDQLKEQVLKLSVIHVLVALIKG